ncbi:MAG: hypothetical protein D3910_07310 [Candidatus Electrothrix sp. ATG2]|nr:hypothetical protein [Candidatus Electrothrix sp. ATG2]
MVALFDGNLNGINGQADFFHTFDVLSGNFFMEIASILCGYIPFPIGYVNKLLKLRSFLSCFFVNNYHDRCFFFSLRNKR